MTTQRLADLNICEVEQLHFADDVNSYLEVGWVLLETAAPEDGPNDFEFIVGYPDRRRQRGTYDFKIRYPKGHPKHDPTPKPAIPTL